jgi:hypothetical protein
MTGPADTPTANQLRAELAEATRELREHLASWEYAYAMGCSRHGASEHPVLWAARSRADRLRARQAALQARLAEHEV